jgi:hypothetical protein
VLSETGELSESPLWCFGQDLGDPDGMASRGGIGLVRLGQLNRLDVIELRCLLGMEGIPKVNGLLEVEPELRFGTGEPGEAEGGVGRDGTLSLHDFVHSRIRHAEPASRLFLGNSERNEEIFVEDLAGMRGAAMLGQKHKRLLETTSMIVNDFNVLGPLVGPTKTNSILIVDSNGVLPSSVSLQLF